MLISGEADACGCCDYDWTITVRNPDSADPVVDYDSGEEDYVSAHYTWSWVTVRHSGYWYDESEPPNQYVYAYTYVSIDMESEGLDREIPAGDPEFLNAHANTTAVANWCGDMSTSPPDPGRVDLHFLGVGSVQIEGDGEDNGQDTEGVGLSSTSATLSLQGFPCTISANSQVNVEYKSYVSEWSEGNSISFAPWSLGISHNHGEGVSSTALSALANSLWEINWQPCLAPEGRRSMQTVITSNTAAASSLKMEYGGLFGGDGEGDMHITSFCGLGVRFVDVDCDHGCTPPGCDPP